VVCFQKISKEEFKTPWKMVFENLKKNKTKRVSLLFLGFGLLAQLLGLIFLCRPLPSSVSVWPARSPPP
jgi:hypothetical protein